MKLKYPQGGFLDGLKMFSPGKPGKYFGPAVTVKMVEASDTTAPKPERHFADCNEAGSIMYIQQPKGLPSACWGGLMSTRAKYLGAEAVVIDGRFRDLEEHKELQFPVSLMSFFVAKLKEADEPWKLFARSSSILGSNTFTRASEINVPLQFQGDLWVHPGDIIVADIDGVVVTPPSLVEQVVALCQERAEIDAKMFEGLQKGETMGHLIKTLRKGS